jgi:TonB family protein
MHMFLLGTGIVFARYAGDLFQGRRDPIVVMLVGEEGSAETAGESKKRSQRTSSLSEQWILPAPQEQPLKNGGLVPDDGPVQRDTTENSGPAGADRSDNDQVAGARSGSVSSEQWAVIVSSLERVKTYPRMARERGIQGVAHVRFRLRPTGDVENVEIVKSSGYDILDTASIRTVYRAAPMPYVSGWVEVPMAYILK